MKKIFNLSRFSGYPAKEQRTAFYESVRGYWNANTRGWSNCYKNNCGEGKSPYEAWKTCLDSYQKSENKDEWMLDNPSFTK